MLFMSVLVSGFSIWFSLLMLSHQEVRNVVLRNAQVFTIVYSRLLLCGILLFLLFCLCGHLIFNSVSLAHELALLFGQRITTGGTLHQVISHFVSSLCSLLQLQNS